MTHEKFFILTSPDTLNSTVARTGFSWMQPWAEHGAESCTCEAMQHNWLQALMQHDKETALHSMRVGEMTVRLARRIGFTEAELEHIHQGALLHDIGKLKVPESILCKPGQLNAIEWRIMRHHPIYAYKMLSAYPCLHPAIEIAFCHHEQWDGSGYPCGLKGYEIPLAARVFAIVDVWDALRSHRPYRPAWDTARVHAYLRDHAGTHFDPHVAETFLSLLAEEEAQSEPPLLAETGC